MSAFETFWHAGLRVELHYDSTGCGNPRDADNLAVLYCWHPDYGLGDEQFTDDDHDTIQDVYRHCRAQGATVIMPLFLYDHSGITIHAGDTIEKLSREAVDTTNRNAFDCQGWDTSWVGFAYATEEKRKSLGVRRSRTEVERRVRGEVDEYDQYLCGEVYGFVIEDEYGRHLDSLWGMLGHSHASEEARRAAEFEAECKQGAELNRLPVAA